MNLSQISMKTLLRLLPATVLTTLLPYVCLAGEYAPVVTLDAPLNLLKQPREAFRFHLNPETAEDASETAEDVFKLDPETGHLLVSGRTWGYIRTANRYRDYKVSLDYRFLGPTFGTRKEKARDTGLLLHCFGDDGSFKVNWMPSIEAQIMEGTTGDFIVLGPFNDAGIVTPVHLESTGTKMSGQPIPSYDPDGASVAMPEDRPLTNAIASKYRHADWKQKVGDNFETDADHPTGEKWNKLEVVCEGDTITTTVNGKIVNKGRNASPTLGFLAIQSEGAEVEFRSWIISPIAKGE